MKWIKEPIPNTGYFEDMFALRKEEAVLLGKVLKKPLNEYLKRLDKLNDIHESGEATVRQENSRIETEDKVALLHRFIQSVTE